MHYEFSVTTDCQPARSKTFSALRFSQRYVTVPLRGRASARQVIVQDWMHSYDVAINICYCADDVPTTVTDLFAAADQPLFKRVLNNELHVLQPLLPYKTISCYKLRPRKHNRRLIRKPARCENVVQRFILTFLFFYVTFRRNCMSLFTCFMSLFSCCLSTLLYEYMDWIWICRNHYNFNIAKC